MTAISPQKRLNTIYSSVKDCWPSRAKSKFSFIKVLNVVKPPQKPVTNNSLAFGERCPPIAHPERMPIRKHPNTLTMKVPIGKVKASHWLVNFDTRYRSPPPKKLPTHTNNNCFIAESIKVLLPSASQKHLAVAYR